MITTVWPEPASSGAGLRMMELLQLFLTQSWRVTVASTAADSEYMADLSELDVTRMSIRVNCSSFDRMLEQLQPELVLFDRFTMEEQFGWRVERHCPQAMRVLETIDLHCLREARHQRFKSQAAVTQQVGQAELYNAVAVREIAAIFRSDLSILVSDYEMDLLPEQFAIPPALLQLCPFMFDLTQLDAEVHPAWSERAHFMSIGNFRHAPNWDAVLWLKQQIWPLIRAQLPEAELHLYGAYAPPKATALHDPATGFHMRGRADDVGRVMQQARICLAPLRFGAGIKTKLADAMLAGTPNVTTSIGAEGMCRELPWSGVIADEAVQIADAAVALYRDEPHWQQARQHGFDIMQSHFNAALNGPALIERLLALRADLAAHRRHNFTGSMLRHHHQRSTEFMSRWIEAKHRVQEISPAG